MAWSPTSTAPLLLSPALPLQTFNWSSEIAWAGNNWAQETAPAVRTLNAAVIDPAAYFGSYTIKENPGPGVTASALNIFTDLSAIKKDTGNYYFYCWVFPMAGNATSTVRLDCRLTGAGTYYSSVTNYAITTDLPNRQWSLIRQGPASVSSANLAAWTTVNLRCITVAGGADNPIVYFDGAFFGKALDFQDLGPTPRASLEHPYDAPKTVPSVSTMIPNGQTQGVRFNLGYEQGVMKTDGVDAAAKATISTFQDYISDATNFTILHNRLDLTRDYYPKAAMMTGEDGFMQVPGHTSWVWNRSFEAIP